MLRVCRVCASYTLSEMCPAGHGPTRTPHPARFSPQDRWAKYRRALTATVNRAEVPAR
ncbi:MAG: RNA-protein complex protein Nop10 [Thermoplasmata archaeon]|nr:RNA-protein complex protein Nop10 [Thermoplasmata archaeon]